MQRSIGQFQSRHTTFSSGRREISFPDNPLSLIKTKQDHAKSVHRNVVLSSMLQQSDTCDRVAILPDNSEFLKLLFLSGNFFYKSHSRFPKSMGLLKISG